MDQRKLVENLFNAIEKSDFTTAESYLSGNFKMTGISPMPLGAKEFLGAHKSFNKGMPDFKFNYKMGNVKDNIVEAKVKLSGTHTQEMPSPIPGVQNIPATNKKVNMPEEPITFTIKDNKIESIHVENRPGGGVAGVLKQLGVEVPIEAHVSH